MYEILLYQTSQGVVVFEEWTRGLRDRLVEARIAVRLDRLQQGNFGDTKSLGNGLHELRINYGPGFRVYYAMAGSQIVLLLCGGDKGSQQSDIAAAARYLKDYRQRSVKS